MTYKLLELNYHHVRDARFEVAVLPLGATEPHNLHLPYGTDVLEGTIVGEQICQAATERGARVVLLPTIPYGTETNLEKFPLAMNVNPSTLNLVIEDLVRSLVRSDIRKILLLNSHGGNDFKPLLRELYGKIDASIFLCNWYQAFSDQYDAIFQHHDDHAGEMETSFALAYFPHLVGKTPDGQLIADEGRKAVSRLRAVREGWVAITRPWHLLTTSSGAGNPHAADADKARKMMEIVVQRLSDFLVELSETPRDATFPF